MDFDSIINFKNAMFKSELSSIDIYMLTSIVNNRNLDLNLSLRDNVKNLSNKAIDNDFLNDSITELLSDTNSLLDVPCYYLMLSKPSLWGLVLTAHRMNQLSEDTLLFIVENLVGMFIDYDENVDYDIVAKYLIDFLSVRKPNDVKLFQSSATLTQFVYEYVYCLYSKPNADAPKSHSLLTRYVLLKLFSFGYAKLNYLNLVDPTESFTEIIEPLMEQGSFSHICLLVNRKTVTYIDAYALKDVIESELLKYDVTDEKIQKFIHDINMYINVINPDVSIEVSNSKKR